jgi:GIY-YIG catalytic domain-containing protein
MEMSPRKSGESATLSGVYQIRCKQNGKIYVGSAVNLRWRWHSHRRDLGNGVHVNPHLQSAWNLYGETSFEFSVLEYVEEHRLLRTEQLWIDKTGCTDRRVGFNIKLDATSAGEGVGLTWEGFRDPAGNPVTITNLHDFCRRNGLDFPSMHRLWKGQSKLKSYRGWTHSNSVRQREFIKTHEGFVDPNGRPVGPIRNLAAFCREHGLDNTHMTAVASGRIVSHRGWTHLEGKKRLPALVHRGYIAPGGAHVRITNLAAFCRACGLCVAHMHEVKSGKRPSHKGWTWKHDADQAFE